MTFFCFLFLIWPHSSYSANSCEDVVKTAASLNDTKWNFRKTTIDWHELDENGRTKFYAIAGLNRAGVLYFNLKLMTETGDERSLQMSGRKFTQKALEYFQGQGRLVTAIKGWWIFRPNPDYELTLEQQIEEIPFFSMNFRDYWLKRKKENDPEAAKQTWTGKMAAGLGYPNVALVSEYTLKDDYKSVYVTFLPNEFDVAEVKKSVLGDQQEAFLPLKASFLEAGMGEDPQDTAISVLFNLQMDERTRIAIVEKNSQLASDLKMLGFEIVGVEKIKTEYGTKVFLRVR